ncbi:MAG: DMT family transporter [Hydrogenophaga sp.]|uniref:DMT family transporter n=1 Tax=Hydrogenophaga sp. TaxID=1904254 RepID=UPI0040352D85
MIASQKKTAWLILLFAALLEPVWLIALKRSQEFTVFWPGVIGLGVVALSLGLLTLALRDLPMGTAYAVWVGVGCVTVALSGITWMGESGDPFRLACMGLILVGVAGLKATT